MRPLLPAPRRRAGTPVPRGGAALAALATLAALAGACGPDETRSPEPRELAPSRTAQTSGTDALLQAVSPVDDSVVWASGHEGTWARTLDGGATWEAAVVPGADTLQFRDVDAFDARTAYLMSAGPGALSRIYRTDDGGATWTLQYTADHPDAFLDCMAFWDAERGIAYGDAVEGVLFVLRTVDGGATWSRVPSAALPPAQDGEGGFAASGSCVDVAAGGRAWIATGNAGRPRVLRTDDFGATWAATDVPVVGGTGSGLTTVGVLEEGTGFALGGTIGADSVRLRSVAVTEDGGRTWREGGRLRLAGPVYGATFVPETPGPALVAVGPGGADWSPDLGATWLEADTLTYWAVAFSSREAGWAVGPEGRITRFGFEPR